MLAFLPEVTSPGPLDHFLRLGLGQKEGKRGRSLILPLEVLLDPSCLSVMAESMALCDMCCTVDVSEQFSCAGETGGSHSSALDSCVYTGSSGVSSPHR